MKGNKNSLGYTIIEVMIVLAVSGVMFGIAAGFISGKQSSAAFTQGVHNFANKVQATIQDVSDGHYSDIGSFKCNKAGSKPNFSSAPVSQGENQDCTYAGKFIHSPVSNNTRSYEIFALAALRDDIAYKTVVPIYKTSVVDLTAKGTVPQTLDIKSIKRDGGAVIYGFGFLQSQGTKSGASYDRGSGTIKLTYAPGLNAANIDTPTAANLLESDGTTSKYDNTINSVAVCLTDGTRTATVNIGNSNGNKLDVDVKVEPC